MNNTTKVTGTISYVAEMTLAESVPAWSRHLLTTFIAVAFLLGIPGNCLVVKVHCCIKKRSVTDWMIFYLAVSDLCSLSTCAPSFILTNVGVWRMFMPSWMCKFHYTLLNTSYISSNVLIAVTALVRMRKMMGKSDMLSSKQACYSGIGLMILSLGFSTIAFKLNGNNPEGHCYFIPQTKQLQRNVYIILLAIAILCSVMSCVCYSKIAYFLRKTRGIHPNNVNADNALSRNHIRALRSSRLMGVVSFVFVCSAVIPSTTGTLLMGLDLKKSYATNILVFLLTRLYFMNNFVNPILYVCMSSTFRSRMLSGWCLEKISNQYASGRIT